MDYVEVMQRLTAAAATVVSTPAQTMTPHDWVPASVECPCIYPSDARIDFDQTYGRGNDLIVATLQLLCSRADDREGQRMLNGYLRGSGAASVKAAIEADKTLAGACDSLHVAAMTGIRAYEIGKVWYVGAEWTVRIIGTGS